MAATHCPSQTIRYARFRRGVEQAAYALHDAGERVSNTNVYHRIKRQLQLPVAYDFQIGRMIADTLDDLGWQASA